MSVRNVPLGLEDEVLLLPADCEPPPELSVLPPEKPAVPAPAPPPPAPAISILVPAPAKHTSASTPRIYRRVQVLSLMALQQPLC